MIFVNLPVADLAAPMAFYEALGFDNNPQFTDDTAACELIGQPVKLVESSTPNPKATSPADIPYLELLLTSPA